MADSHNYRAQVHWGPVDDIVDIDFVENFVVDLEKFGDTAVVAVVVVVAVALVVAVVVAVVAAEDMVAAGGIVAGVVDDIDAAVVAAAAAVVDIDFDVAVVAAVDIDWIDSDVSYSYFDYIGREDSVPVVGVLVLVLALA